MTQYFPIIVEQESNGTFSAWVAGLTVRLERIEYLSEAPSGSGVPKSPLLFPSTSDCPDRGADSYTLALGSQP